MALLFRDQACDFSADMDANEMVHMIVMASRSGEGRHGRGGGAEGGGKEGGGVSS